MKITMMGYGSFGRALTELLRRKWPEAQITVWKRGLELKPALEGADYAVYAVPAQAFREVFAASLPYLPAEALVVNVAKGIELGSLKRLSEVAREYAPALHYAALSGPSHAEEIAESLPTAVTVCAEEAADAARAQQLFMTESFRIYTGSDLIGTEIGGAVKNVIALAAGISDGLGFGDNTKAALMTRGMAEISRLGQALGADPATFPGLTGFGDLIVTCTSMHSRNRRCGILIGQGLSAKEAAERVGMVVEGIPTARAARDLARQMRLEMPITDAVCRVLSGEISAREAVSLLMTRDGKAEN